MVGLPCYSACKVNSDCDQQVQTGRTVRTALSVAVPFGLDASSVLTPTPSFPSVSPSHTGLPQGSCPLCSAHGACLGSSEYEALEKKLAAEAAKFAELLKKN